MPDPRGSDRVRLLVAQATTSVSRNSMRSGVMDRVHTPGWFPSAATPSFASSDLDDTAGDDAFEASARLLDFDFPVLRNHDGRCISERYADSREVDCRA